MRFALLAYTSPDVWASMSREEHAAWWVDGAALDAELADRAVVVTALDLADHATATTVRVRGGEVRVADDAVGGAPLAGVLVIDVPDLDTALDVARRSPAARTGSVEVRPGFVTIGPSGRPPASPGPSDPSGQPGRP